jgi:hypothetical protein
MRGLRRLSQSPSAAYGATTAAAVLLSVAGVVYAVHWGEASDGGRGGALGCTLTFLIFFLTRSTPEQALQAPLLPGRAEEPDVLALPAPADADEMGSQLQRLKQQTARLRAAVASMLDAAAREKLYLSIASVVSTLTWGFGDKLAGWFGAA